MSEFDLITFDEKEKKIKFNKWVEWKHVGLGGNRHCEICMKLDRCWFDNKIRPELPQHWNCHCRLTPIPKPVAGVNSMAKCDIRKFTEYIFSEKYSWNGKRKLFENLGFSVNDAYYLKEEYEKQAVENYCSSKYKLAKLDEQGQRINIDINFIKNGRKIIFTSGWMVKPKGVITNNTPLAD